MTNSLRRDYNDGERIINTGPDESRNGFSKPGLIIFLQGCRHRNSDGYSPKASEKQMVA
jgi:hypothetical protein